MKANELKKNDRVWCWWMSRYFWFQCVNSVTGKYVFEDAGDCRFDFTAADVEKMEVR